MKVLARDNYRCCSCGRPGRLEVDHIVPISKNGSKYALDNLQSLCQSCHREKTEAENPGLAEKRAWMAYLLESE